MSATLEESLCQQESSLRNLLPKKVLRIRLLQKTANLVATDNYKKDSDFDEILDDLFRIGVENLKRIRQDKFQNSKCEQDVDLEEDHEEDEPLIPEPIHTTPPNDDYVASATKSILDELLEEFGDEILNVTMVYEEADFNPTKDLEELERLLAKEPQSNFTEIQVHSIIINTEPFIHTQLMNPLYGVFKTSKPCKVDRDIRFPGRLCTIGGAWILNKLRGSIANRTSWMLYMWLVKSPVVLDIARGRRLGAWLRACCLFIITNKSRGVSCPNSTIFYS
ncbi:hypothetical protein Tco_0324500 [Tanacetum coccineum]